ncbi:MAG: phosphopantetheine-binding protein [Firmicutes bacterium]|nr:phosphopantetheine-binding protein [Bacillota bacterium]
MDIQQQLFERLKEYKDSLKNVNLTLETSFDELGFDSLDKMEMLMEIETEYSITFPDELNISNMGELVAKIKELKG